MWAFKGSHLQWDPFEEANNGSEQVKLWNRPSEKKMCNFPSFDSMFIWQQGKNC